MSDPVGAILVPPRPNLGPEPWPKSSPLESLWLVLGILILPVAAWLIWRMCAPPGSAVPIRTPAPAALDVTPRGRLVALSTSTKNALASRFGSTWHAKTTEELAAESALKDVLGPEMLGQLIEFLDRIDRLKFAPERPNHNGRSLPEELAAWDPRVAGLIARIGAKANGRHDKQAPARSRLRRPAADHRPRPLALPLERRSGMLTATGSLRLKRTPSMSVR